MGPVPVIRGHAAAEEVDSSFQARHLIVPIQDAFCLDSELPVREALANLNERRFDQAPVVRDGALSGFVLRSPLEAAAPTALVGSVERTLGQGNVVSANAPVGSLLEWVEQEGFLFVIDGREILGFVTVSDFNKQPARGYMYLLIGKVEAALSDLLRSRFRDAHHESLGFLNPTHARFLRKKYEQDVRDNVEADLISVLGFPDLIDIAIADQPIRFMFGALAMQLENQRGGLVDMRNRIMHTNLSLVTRKDTLIRLREKERLLRAVIDRATSYLFEPR